MLIITMIKGRITIIRQLNVHLGKTISITIRQRQNVQVGTETMVITTRQQLNAQVGIKTIIITIRQQLSDQHGVRIKAHITVGRMIWKWVAVSVVFSKNTLLRM